MYNVAEYLENSARRYPDKTAVIDEKNSYTYAQLLKISRQTGSVLIEKKIHAQPVAVMMEKSADTLAAFLGIACSGNFYCLLNPQLPSYRLAQIQNVLQAGVVIIDDENDQRANDLFPDALILKMDELKKAFIDEEKLIGIQKNTLDSDPLYINFTSGSTGNPKGVVVSHGSVIDFIDVFCDVFDFKSNEIFGNQAPFDFDVSVKDIYSSLKTGATLVIIPKHLFSQPSALLDFLCEHQVTVMIWAVSALCLLTSFHALDYKVPHTVTKVLFSGEAMPMKHLHLWMHHLQNAMFVNLYGPTEITCNCTYHIIDRKNSYEKGLPIGRAFSNEKVFLLDDNGKEVKKAGVTGEICVGGRTLASGYYNDEKQSAERFVQNPLHRHYHERIYLTGDLGKYDEDGNLYFCGRKDFQIKHMGHRIELEEIEKHMAGMEGVDRCICVYDDEKKRLYAYYTGSCDKKEIYAYMKEKLPVYMIPNVIQRVKELKLNKNGKIDRSIYRKDLS